MVKTLIVILGPTGVGKTALSMAVAKHFGGEIISADSRQIYKGIPIGTAAPTIKEREQVPHHFVETLELSDYFSAGRFEEGVIDLLQQKLFASGNWAVMCGGSMMYIDAVCKGIDDLPTIDKELRSDLVNRLESEGLESLRLQLKLLDPEHYAVVDLQNGKRVLHALEVCLMTGKPYSSLRTNKNKDRPFRIIKIGLTREREDLYDRINRRVDQMIEDGLLEEARSVYPLRNFNSLNTVGFKELFAYFEGKSSLDEAIAQIKRNSRVYSRKQMTWFKRDSGIQWFHPDDEKRIIEFIEYPKEAIV